MRKGFIIGFMLGIWAFGLGAAQLGEWGTNLSEARDLAERYDRPIMILFWNTNGSNRWSDLFKSRILDSEAWAQAAAAQKMAMVAYDRKGVWNEGLYQLVASNNTETVHGYPVLYFLDSSAQEVLDDGIFSYRPETNVVKQTAINAWIEENLTPEVFLERLEAILGEYWLEETADVWDPKDDRATGATTLSLGPAAASQLHTLGGAYADGNLDTADWFAFQPKPATTNRFEVKATLNYSRETLYATNREETATYRVLPDAVALPDGTYPPEMVTEVLLPDPPDVTLEPDFATNVVAVLTSNVVGQVYAVTSRVSVVVAPVVNQVVTNEIYSAYLPTNTLSEAVYAKLLAEGAMVGATSYWETVGSPSPVAEAIQTPTTVAVTNSEASSAGAVSFRARILASPDVSAMRDFQVYETGSVTNEISLEASEVLVNLFYPCTEKRYTGKHFLYLAQLGDASQTNQYRVTSWTPEVTNRSVTATTHRWNRSEAKAYAVFTNEFEVVSVSTETNGLNKIITFATNRYWTASLVCTSRYAAVAERVVTNQTQTVISSTNEVRYTSHGDAQYRLRSQSWKPGTVGFGSAAMKVSETAEKVSIPIKRTGGNSGVVRLRYWTEDGTATGWMAGNTPDGNVDFAHQSGILTWPDGGSATTNLVIDLIQDLRPIWEGDETFTVHLEPAEDAERFQAALTVDTLTVTLSEKTTRSPGKATVAGYQTGEDEGMVSFVNPKKPTLTAFAGSTVTLYVAREDGTDGILDATVVPTSKNRADPTVTVAYPGGAAELIWTNGVAETLPVEVTLPLLDEASREVVLTVKSATKGAVKTPASVTVTVLNQAATCASTELADAEPWGITVKDAAKAWYWDASESLVGSVAPKQTVTFQLSVTGPGVLRYGWSAEGWSAASSWLCSGGVAKRSYPGTASTDEVLVKAGKQTITWTVKNNGAAELVPTLADLRWHPLPTVDLPVPGNGAQTSSTRLDYTLFPTNTVLLGKTVTAVDSELMVDLEVTCLAPKPDEAVILSAGDAEAFFDDPAAKLTPKTTVSWRVDVAYADGDGNRLVRTGAKWGFTLMDPAAEATDAPLPETVDQDETESYLAYRGIWCDLGVVTPAESGYSYKILGPLPKGMKLLDNRTGRIGGAPSATGTFAFELQAVGPDRLPRTSRTIRIRVLEATDDQIAAITVPGNWVPGAGMVAGYRLQVAVGQETEWALPEPLDGVRVAAGSLPSGLRFIAAEGALSGIPTKAGRFFLSLQGTSPQGETLYRTVVCEVLPITVVAGTYSGWVPSVGDDDRPLAAGLATLTVNPTGAWSFQATVEGTTKRFAGKGFSNATFWTEGVETVTLDTEVMVTLAGEAWIQSLELTVDAETRSVGGSLRIPWRRVDEAGEVDVESVDYPLDGTLFYVYGAQKAEQAMIAPFKGYYVATLPVTDFARPSAEADKLYAPQGCGYLTFTVDAKGSVKWSALLADGNAVSGASSLIFDGGTNEVTEARFLVYGKPSAYGKVDGGLCGLFLLDLTDPCLDRTGFALTPVLADPAVTPPAWWCFDAKRLRQPTGADDGPGFFAVLDVKGAYYDKVMNLQSYYLNKSLRFADGGGVAASLDSVVTVDTAEPGWFIRTYYADFDGPNGASGYQLVTESYLASLDGTSDAWEDDEEEDDPAEMAEDEWDSFLPFGMALTVGARSLTVPAKKVVKGGSGPGAFGSILYNDQTDGDGNVIAGSGSRNLSALKVSFSQATGILSGSFELNYERKLPSGSYAQKKKTVTLKGVYVPFYSMADDALGGQGWGFYLLPDKDALWDGYGRLQTYSFTYSLPFALESVEAE